MTMTFSRRAEWGKAAILTRMMTRTYRKLKIRMMHYVEKKQRWNYKHGSAHYMDHTIFNLRGTGEALHSGHTSAFKSFISLCGYLPFINCFLCQDFLFECCNLIFFTQTTTSLFWKGSLFQKPQCYFHLEIHLYENLYHPQN